MFTSERLKIDKKEKKSHVENTNSINVVWFLKAKTKRDFGEDCCEISASIKAADEHYRTSYSNGRVTL